MLVASIYFSADGEYIVECSVETELNFIRNSTKNAAEITLNWSGTQKYPIGSNTMCEIITTGESRSVSEYHKSNLVQKLTKTINWEENYTHNVNMNKIIFHCLTLKHVIIRYILQHRIFVRIWKPNVSIQVKIPKLASNPPRWVNYAPN